MAQRLPSKHLCCNLLTRKTPKNQEGNRRLAVFRLGSLSGSLLTQPESYLKVVNFVTTCGKNFFVVM